MSQIQDVVIVGGGLVGGLTALLLAQGGVQAVVLDAAPILDTEKALAQPNPRVLALNQATIHLLEQVDVWPELARHMPYTGMQVWNQNGYGEIVFGKASERMPIREEWLGSMVEPSVLNFAIQTQLQRTVKDYRSQVKVTRVEQYPQGWMVHLASGEMLHTKLVIGADGANSFVRDQAMIDLDVLDYRQIAMSCAIKTQKAHQHVARQIFLPTGPLAFLPMVSAKNEEQGHWQSIVWSLPEDFATEYAGLDDHAFMQQLTQSSLHMLGEVTAVESRAHFPLKARAAVHYVKAGLALVGDAAHVIHPLAGQGVNIGCLDAAILCDVLLKDLARGSWANLQTLRRYEHQRKGQNLAMMHSMSMLGWLESTTLTPLIWARTAGLNFVERTPFLKDRFMQQADGLSQLKSTRYA